jgi:hypothetical protein
MRQARPLRFKPMSYPLMGREVIIGNTREDSDGRMFHMKNIFQNIKTRTFSTAGKIGWAILWLLGVPLPILLILYACSGHH